MIKTLRTLFRQDKEKFVVPKTIQDAIPINAVYKDGIFIVGKRYSKTFRFDDINYAVAGKEEKEAIFLEYSELLNALDSGCGRGTGEMTNLAEGTEVKILAENLSEFVGYGANNRHVDFGAGENFA